MENPNIHESANTNNTSINTCDVQTMETKIQDHSVPAENATSHDTDTTMENAIETGTAEEPASPQLTHALEALLGGFDSPLHAVEAVSVVPQAQALHAAAEPEQLQISPLAAHAPVTHSLSTVQVPESSSVDQTDKSVAETVNAPIIEQISSTRNISTNQNIETEKAPVTTNQINTTSPSPYPAIPGLFLGNAVDPPVPPPVQNEASQAGVQNTENAGRYIQMGNNVPVGEDTPMAGGAEVEGEHPEWEIDSSPIESSSDDSSSDDSLESESETGEHAYKLLSPEEQARILMEGDGGSDDEGGGKAKAGSQLRTKNEVPDVVVPKPDVIITPEMPIMEVGNVEHIVENVLVIKARTSGENRALESGSVLCLEDRSVIGVVAEILGPVQKPLYSVMFTNAGEITEAGLTLGTKVFYSEKHSTFIFTQALKAYKGSDASNLHDEEVGDEEMEFSDDEKEAEHKRRVKQKRIERRGGKVQNGGSGRGGHPLQQQQTPYDSNQPISYDDPEEDGPYRPLARPVGFENSVGHGEAPQEGAYTGNFERPNREPHRGRGRGGDRGRGDRGRVRGDRGRGRGGYQDRRSGGGNGHSLPPRPQSHQQAPNTYPQSQYQQPAPGIFNQPPAPSPSVPNFYMPPVAYSPQQPQMPWPQFPPQFQQAFQHGQNPWQPPPGNSGPPPPPGGAFINPAFLPGQWSNQNGQNGQNGGK